VAVVGGSSEGKKFASYLVSPAAQQIWASKGYRPVISGVPGANFPNPPGLFTIASLGGWKSVNKQFFEKETGFVTKLEQSLGVSTAK
jgi:sulfate/thiosulfate transport system substrate-binding protein